MAISAQHLVSRSKNIHQCNICHAAFAFQLDECLQKASGQLAWVLISTLNCFAYRIKHALDTVVVGLLYYAASLLTTIASQTWVWAKIHSFQLGKTSRCSDSVAGSSKLLRNLYLVQGVVIFSFHPHALQQHNQYKILSAMAPSAVQEKASCYRKLLGNSSGNG